MRSETLPVQQSSGFLRGRLRQLSWLAIITFSALFWGSLLVFIF